MDTFDNINDRTGWPSGAWDHEPDRATWRHDGTGASCTLRRGPLGSWCGYVGVGPNHPAAGKDYDNLDVHVHGGLTYAAYCQPLAEDEWIRYRLIREKWVTESLLYPTGDAARHLREDRKGDTSTYLGWQEWIRQFQLCHDDCPHGLWWVGFDTAHAWDVVPGMMQYYAKRGFVGFSDAHYKTFAWMVDETNRLADEMFKVEVISDKKGNHHGT